MLIGRIHGATRYLGKPPDWDDSKGVHCGSLAILDMEAANGDNVMVSAWLPTPDEVARIVAGKPVHLHVWGIGHPPVALTVGE